MRHAGATRKLDLEDQRQEEQNDDCVSAEYCG